MRPDSLYTILKTILISSAVSLAIGFSFGWLIKSASANLEGYVPLTVQNRAPSRPLVTPADSPTGSPAERARTNDIPTKGVSKGAAALPEAAKHADRAKWMRLIEVLGLDTEQVKALEATIEEAIPRTDTSKPVDVLQIEAAALLEKNILALLNADQRKSFVDMQDRAKNNRIELSAQKTYSQELGELDLSPEQRAKALDSLRDQAERTSAEIPSSTHLLLTGSLLPIGDVQFTEEAIYTLRQLTPEDIGNAGLEKIAEIRRAEAKQKAKLMEAVLTPAQLELYRSRLSQTPDILDQIRSGG